MAADHPFIDRFASAWREATLDSLMAPLAEDVTLIQPLSPPLVGKLAARKAFARILYQYPGLRGEGVSGLGDDRRALITWTMCVPVGGRTLRVPVVDDFEFRNDQVARRVAYFDPSPIVRSVARRPSTWPRQIMAAVKKF